MKKGMHTAIFPNHFFVILCCIVAIGFIEGRVDSLQYMFATGPVRYTYCNVMFDTMSDALHIMYATHKILP